MQILKCDCCGGDKMQKQGQNSMVCSFCGSVYLLDKNEKIIDRDVTDAKVFALYLQAEKFRQKNDVLNEIQVLTLALELDDRKVSTWVKLGRAYRAGNSFDKAIEYYRKAIDIDPDYPMSYANIGAIYLIKRDYAMALPYYEKAVSLISEDDTDYPTTIANYAVALANTGDKKKAARLINEAEKRGYDNAEAARRVAGIGFFSKLFR